jgi:hypothetical protein
MLAIGRKFLQHVLPGILRPVRVLWNEIVGFVFLALAVSTVPSIYRGIREFDGEGQDVFRLIMAGFFALVMAGFAVSSFLRARKISRF